MLKHVLIIIFSLVLVTSGRASEVAAKPRVILALQAELDIGQLEKDKVGLFQYFPFLINDLQAKIAGQLDPFTAKDFMLVAKAGDHILSLQRGRALSLRKLIRDLYMPLMLQEECYSYILGDYFSSSCTTAIHFGRRTTSEKHWSQIVKDHICALKPLWISAIDVMNEDLRFNEGVFEKLIPLCPRLTYLDLSWQNNADTNAVLKVVGMNCPDLKYLKLYGNHSLSDVGISYLAKPGSKLKHIDIGSCVVLTIDGLKAIAENCSFLQHLGFCQLKWFTGEDLRVLNVNNLPLLTSISLSHLIATRHDYSYEATIHNLTILVETCSRLTSLDLSWCNFENGCDISPSILEIVAKNNPRLKALTFLNANLGVCQLELLGQRFKNLVALRLINCLKGDRGDEASAWDSTKGLPSLLRGCTKLALLDISHTRNQLFTTEQLEKMKIEHPNLERIITESVNDNVWHHEMQRYLAKDDLKHMRGK